MVRGLTRTKTNPIKKERNKALVGMDRRRTKRCIIIHNDSIGFGTERDASTRINHMWRRGG